MTALFADIKGSTELEQDLDPEEASAIIDPALKLMIEAAHRYDGYLVQSTGDGIFALFGAPVAHEDHPQRLYAALAMQEELHRYAERLRAAGKIPVEARVGVNTGEVVVRTIATGAGHTEYTPIGHTANLAARMQTAAPAGSIAASEATQRLCEGKLNRAKVMAVSGYIQCNFDQIFELEILPIVAADAESVPCCRAINTNFAGLDLLFEKLERAADPVNELLATDGRKLRLRIMKIVDVDGFEPEIGAAHLDHRAEIARRYAMRTLDQIARPDDAGTDEVSLKPFPRIRRHRAVEGDISALGRHEDVLAA